MPSIHFRLNSLENVYEFVSYVMEQSGSTDARQVASPNYVTTVISSQFSIDYRFDFQLKEALITLYGEEELLFNAKLKFDGEFTVISLAVEIAAKLKSDPSSIEQIPRIIETCPLLIPELEHRVPDIRERLSNIGYSP